MDFELIISGLCVIALKSGTAQPANPDAVDIICPEAGMHRPRLNYPPIDVQPDINLMPDMVVDNLGDRFASLDLSGGNFLDLSFSESPYNEFSLQWEGDPMQQEPGSPESMNWVPRLADLGFGDFTVADPPVVPTGAAARFALPYGQLICADVVKRKNGTTALWSFPAAERGAGHIRAVANFVRYRIKGVGNLTIKRNNAVILTAAASVPSLTMCLSDDVDKVPYDYNSDQTQLDHLAHLGDHLTTGNFQVPTLYDPQNPVRTAHPICNQVLFNHG